MYMCALHAIPMGSIIHMYILISLYVYFPYHIYVYI